MDNETLLSIDEVCSLTGQMPETVRRKCKSGEYKSTVERKGRFKIYSILLTSLPQVFQDEYLQVFIDDTDKKNKNLLDYADAPIYARKQADKYLKLLELTKNMSHSQIIDFLKIWNEEHPDMKACYTSVYYARINYEKYGTAGLLSKRCQVEKKSCLNEDYYDYYKSLYLREGAPSAFFCWTATLGYAREKDNVDIVSFPSCKTFDRYLKADVPAQAIFFARYGNAAWYKKYASYVSRGYANLIAGHCWISDHAQIDVAVDFNGKVCFPWVTVFRDAKTSKWLGWFLHPESPNSDHIFQAFYYATLRFGLPNDVYLDNGKDYRSKDFAGGRPNNTKDKNDSVSENSLMRNVGVNVHFALPYNAQTKPVERDFLKVKTYLSKAFIGYRGGKITERPEKLKDEIHDEKIMDFNSFKILFDDFIENYLNKRPSNGKALRGKCPDELWAEEFECKRVISKDALKLFCMRTSKNVTISRNGVYDSQLQITYWADWMAVRKGEKVFIRRDVNAYQEAWVFEANTEKYIGKAIAISDSSFLAETDVEKSVYRKEIERKRKEKKFIKQCIQTHHNPSNEDIINNLKNSLVNTEFISDPKINEISNTKMDQVVKAEKESKIKPAKYVTPLKAEPKLYLTQAEKRRALARKVI